MMSKPWSTCTHRPGDLPRRVRAPAVTPLFLPQSDCIGAGVLLDLASPNPSCPLSFLPNEKSSPLLVATRL